MSPGQRRSVGVLPDDPFTRNIRVKLWYLITNVFPPPYNDQYEGSGLELFFLDKRIREKLGELQLGSGNTTEQRLRDFIVERSTEPELHVVMDSILDAHVMAADRRLADTPMRSVLERAAERESKNIVAALNALLESHGLTPGFDESGRVHVEGLIPTTPKELGNLPGKERLVQDVQSWQTSRKLFGLVFIDLDKFNM